ncbi:DNA helicase, partial [Tanacetum coccineum]
MRESLPAEASVAWLRSSHSSARYRLRLRTRLQHLKHKTTVMAKKVEVLEVAKRCICGGMHLMIGLTLSNEMATEFDIRAYKQMEKLVIIAVTSCCVTRYNGLRDAHTSHRCNSNSRRSKSTTSNKRKQEIVSLLRFYLKLSHKTTRQKVQQQPPFPMCKDHGPQTKAVYSYCFKAIVGDGSATVSITCFSDQANSLTRDCNDVLAKLSDNDLYHLPMSLKELEGQQFRRKRKLIKAYDARFDSEAGKFGTEGGLFSFEEVKNAANNFHISILIGEGLTIKLMELYMRYRYDMTVDEPAELARRSIYHATFHDGSSGGVAS